MRKLYRIRGTNHAWLTTAIFFVTALYGYWQRFVSDGEPDLWRIGLACLLIADLVFFGFFNRKQALAKPSDLRDEISSYLLLVLLVLFVLDSLPDLHQLASHRHPFLLGLGGLVLSGLLVFSVVMSFERWVREPPRSIVARPGGGFLVRFGSHQHGKEIISAIQALPGVQPLHPSAALDETAEWALPADPLAAQALLDFARKYNFDFVPESRKIAPAQNKAARGR
jgi:hypothetical protein